MEEERLRRGSCLKVYMVYGDPTEYQEQHREKQLAKLGSTLQLRETALTYVSSFLDQDSDIYLNEINPLVANTFIIYRRSRIVDKYVNLSPGEENFQRIRASLERTRSATPDAMPCLSH